VIGKLDPKYYWCSWLAVSPDERYLLWAQEDQRIVNLMLVENFQ
jgi:hypothetical protein